MYIVYCISYRVTGLYRLGKTCYLHSLVCNNSIICIVYCAIIVLLHSLLCNMTKQLWDKTFVGVANHFYLVANIVT